MKSKKAVAELPRLEIDYTGATLRFYVTHPNNYNYSFQMIPFGDEGLIHTLNGEHFLNTFPFFYNKIFVQDVVYLRFNMLAPLLRAFKSVASKFYLFEDMGSFTKGGRKFYKIRCQLREEYK